MYIPSHVQIETVNRLCNARCPMCTIRFKPEFGDDAYTDLSYDNTVRPAGFMSLEKFKLIVEKLQPHVESIKYFTLHGCGEPLMDPTICEKIAYLKSCGFRGVGFSTNCHLLTEKMSNRLLDAGIDTLICSIDGFSARAVETIRPRLKRDKIYTNVERFLELRDERDAKSRVLIRFIEQMDNYLEFDEYFAHWDARVSSRKNDEIVKFPIHNCGGKVEDFENKVVPGTGSSLFSDDYAKSDGFLCPDLFERLIVFANGRIGLCSSDQDEYFDIGNALFSDPVELFNSDVFERYRAEWLKGRWRELDHCRTCSITQSRNAKQTVSTAALAS
ncbi:Predicted Fe-S oxidoreductase [alpha proteobacterium BAL199]|nr:Predicted Fe-S oxidoreductase [alpha proteobacterium BAL199]